MTTRIRKLGIQGCPTQIISKSLHDHKLPLGGTKEALIVLVQHHMEGGGGKRSSWKKRKQREAKAEMTVSQV